MRYLTDSEILNWNDRLRKISEDRNNTRLGMKSDTLIVTPKYHHSSSEPLIHFSSRSNFDNTSKTIPEPSLEFNFSFSVASNRVDEFFDILEKLKLNKTGTKIFYQGIDNKEKISDINFSEDVLKSSTKMKHKLVDKEYTRFNYYFSGHLASIMVYVSYLEDAVNFFSSIWGYNEDGTEVNLIKYPIGSIVSKVKDKSKDFLVIDYSYSKINSDYKIILICSEILNSSGLVIKYGDLYKFDTEVLCWSRNNRIDNILN
jgi:hypothetical protein